MDLSTLNLILWIPFLAVALITGLIFGINGFRKGIWRALISLGATVVAALLSILLANLIAPMLVPGIMNQIPEMDFSEMGFMASTVSGIVSGIIKSVLSLVLYVVLLFFTVLILKIVAANIKKQEFVTKTTGLRFAGLGIRLLDTVLYTLLLLLPLYGTLAAYAPAAASLMKYMPENEYSQYVVAVANHPVVALSNASPVSAVYSSLSGFELGGESVNVPKIAATVDKTAQLLEETAGMEPEELIESGKALELVEHLQDEVVNSDWFYAIVSDTVTQAVAQLPEVDDPEAGELLSFVAENLDMSKEDFQKNCDAVLDVVHLVLEKNLIGQIQTEGFSYELLYSSGLLEEMGQMLNSSDQFVALKGLIYQLAADNLLSDAPELVQTLMKNYSNAPLTDPEQLQREVEAFIYLMQGDDEASVIQGFARHPAFGYETVLSVVGQEQILEAFELTNPGSTLAIYMETHPEVAEAVLDKLKECSENPLEDTEFSMYCAALTGLADLYTTNVTAYALDFALDTLGQDYFGNTPLYQLLAECPDIMKKNEEVFANGLDSYLALSGLNDLMNLTLTNAWPSDSLDTDSSEYSQLKNVVRTCCISDQATAILTTLVADKGSDPMGVGANLSAGQKTWLGDALESVGEELKNNSGSSVGDYNVTQNPDGSTSIIVGGNGISGGSSGMVDGSTSITVGGSGVIVGGNGMVIVGGTSGTLENVDETVAALEKFLGLD